MNYFKDTYQTSKKEKVDEGYVIKKQIIDEDKEIFHKF